MHLPLESIAVLVFSLACSRACLATEPFPASDLRFQHVFGTKPADPATYFFLGSGWLRPLTTGSQDTFVKHWLETHPTAVVTPISEENTAWGGRRPPMHWIYVWIEDNEDCLNVALISNGIFTGGVMIDMVEAEERLSEVLLDPKLADARVQVEKERAAKPNKDRPRRLISEASYKDRMARIEAAENEARDNKRGIWSDTHRSERESEGLR